MIAHVVKLDHEADGMVRGDKKMMLMARECGILIGGE